MRLIGLSRLLKQGRAVEPAGSGASHLRLRAAALESKLVAEAPMPRVRIAAMQPYFLPYAGYFRLFLDVDAFVIGDTFQYIRRGWVNRNRFYDEAGRLQWLTVPLCRAPTETEIRHKQFAPDAEKSLRTQIRRFPACRNPEQPAVPILERLLRPHGSMVDYLMDLLNLSCEVLDITPPHLLKMSDIPVQVGLRGQEWALAACHALGATEYVNAPGGRDLYSHELFARHGLSLQFLPPYAGGMESILERLHTATPSALANEIRRNL